MTAQTPKYGQAEFLSDNIRRILAPNPSPMTFQGTNTYILGTDAVAVIDPGPDLDDHLNAILTATENGLQITHILVTHAHTDHSPLAARLSAITGAKIYAFGRAKDGQSDFMRQVEENGYTGGGEGIDHDFIPDVFLADGDQIVGKDWTVTALHTPGHMANHLCFAVGNALFSGDHVMEWATSMVSPPDGDLGDFMTSCARLGRQNWSIFYSGHGDCVRSPNERISWLVAHRRQREAEILTALAQGPNSARKLAEMIYTEIDQTLIPAATRNVFAHLLDLANKHMILFDNPLSAETVFRLR